MKQISIFFLIANFLLLGLKAQNFEWVSVPGGGTSSFGFSVAIDSYGDVINTGQFKDTVDFDPGPGVYSVISEGTTTNFFIQKLSPTGNLIWVKTFNRNLQSKMVIDHQDNIIVTGYFSGTVDFDPGAGVNNFTASGTWDLFTMKFDPSGNVLWVKVYGGTNSENSSSLTTDELGNIYTTGYYMGSVDFDPGPGSYIQSTNWVADIFILKFDSYGNFIWVKTIGSDDIDRGRSITYDFNGNLYLTGYFGGVNVHPDFDPGPGTHTMIAIGSVDIFILKIDTAGNFNWVRNMGSPQKQNHGINIKFHNGYLYTAGNYEGTVDFDPGAGIANYASGGTGMNTFIHKIDSSGNFMWVKTFNASGTGTTISNTIDEIYIGNDESIYATGSFYATADFDPGTGIFLQTSNGIRDFYITKLDNNGNFNWAYTFGDISVDEGSSIYVDDNNNIYVTGKINGTVDFDPGITNSIYTNASSFVFKWSQDSCSLLTLTFDSIAEINCFSPGYASATAANGSAPYTFSWNTSPVTVNSTATFNTSGIYTVTLNDSNSCQRTASILINSPVFGSFDLDVHVIFPPMIAGSNRTIRLDAFNETCDTVSGELILILSPDVTYNFASPAPDSILGDSLIWYFSGLNYNAPHLKPEVNITTPVNIPSDQLLCFTAAIFPIIGDSDTTNNIKYYCRNLLAPFDPNDKQVYPNGACDAGYILNNQALAYTIRFQNIGNTDAVNVYILDTLSSALDINSVRILSKSHEPMITEIVNGNILKFRFDNIYLPDSTTNEPASHGYVIFEVDPHAGTGNGTIINNSASIFFDFNEPIITNAVMNTVVNSIPTVNTQVAQINNTLVSAASGAIYQWIDCNNNFNIIPGEINHSFTATNNGSYAVIVNQGGCIDTSLCYSLIVGIPENVSLNNLIVFPNPFSEELNIRINDLNSSELTIKLLNVLGQVIYSSENERLTDKTEFKISTEGLESGIYFLDLKSEKESLTKKIIKIW